MEAASNTSSSQFTTHALINALIILVISTLAYILALVRVLSKNWWDLAPVHLFQASLYFGRIQVCSSAIIKVTLKIVEDMTAEVWTGEICISQAFNLYTHVCMWFVLLALEADGFTAIHWPYFHCAEVTSRKCCISLAILWCLTLVMTSAGILVDDELFRCQAILFNDKVRPVSLWLTSYPDCLGFIVTIGVSIYVVIQVIKHDHQVGVAPITIQPLGLMPALQPMSTDQDISGPSRMALADTGETGGNTSYNSGGGRNKSGLETVIEEESDGESVESQSHPVESGVTGVTGSHCVESVERDPNHISVATPFSTPVVPQVSTVQIVLYSAVLNCTLCRWCVHQYHR